MAPARAGLQFEWFNLLPNLIVLFQVVNSLCSSVLSYPLQFEFRILVTTRLSSNLNDMATARLLSLIEVVEGGPRAVEVDLGENAKSFVFENI